MDLFNFLHSSKQIYAQVLLLAILAAGARGLNGTFPIREGLERRRVALCSLK
jgi:hypothetical protein